MEKDQTKSRITISKIEKYYRLTNDALEIAKNSIAKGKEKQAKEIFLMVESYLSDSQYFKDNKDYVNAFGCLNYAHGWIDAGARLKIYIVKDNRLFTI